MSFVKGREKSIRSVLQGRKFDIDEYQREYKWQTKHLEELIEDLYSTFSNNYDEEHDRQQVADYSGYFLGSIILNHRDDRVYIVDGQQRLTTLTLLLIYIRHLGQKEDGPDVPNFDDCIFSERFGRRSFNLDVEQRTPCMKALFNRGEYEPPEEDVSIQNIVDRYEDIRQMFPRDLQGQALPYFVDWLLDKVEFVEIQATTHEDAYTIFETMNDRGRPLSPADMLKGYLLSQLPDEQDRARGNELWRDQMLKLSEYDEDGGSSFIKNWLRARYGETYRKGGRGAVNQDYEKIGVAFHKWVRDNLEKLGLEDPADFHRFLMELLPKYAGIQCRVDDATKEYTSGLEPIFYNSRTNFTLQFPFLLAPIQPDDPEEVILEKMRLVSTFCDIYIVRHIVNYKKVTYSTKKYAIFDYSKDVRDLDVEGLSQYLIEQADALDVTWDGTPSGRSGLSGFALNRFTKRYIRYMLARMTAHVEVESGQPDRFREYISRSRDNRYEIEHILATHHDRYADEFEHPEDFRKHRDRFPGLLLLPKKFNASYGDLPYHEKAPHYASQNLLAASLYPSTYERNPGFLQYIKRSGLPFEPIGDFEDGKPRFTKEAMEKRAKLYRGLCEEIWTTERLDVREEF